MTVQELGPNPADVQSLRAELDELLRARQFAAQRERRLTEAARADYARSPASPDQELLRQLAQAQTLREGLGMRCLELSDRLLALEDRLLSERHSSAHATAETVHRHPPAAGPAPHSPATGATTARPARPAQPARKRPTGARFGGVYQHEPEAEPVLPPVEAAQPLRGARFGGAQASPPDAQHTDAAPRPTGALPADPPHPEPAVPATPLRSPGELAALAQRVSELHRRGAAHESAAVVAQAAVTLAPADVARLVALLRTGGPAGSADYLARSVAHSAAGQAAGTLAELRRSGQTDEAAVLFHALWSTPAAALPALLTALEDTGQSADGQTLLWEWASAPAHELAELALRLWESGRAADIRSLLRQAAGRPTADVAAVALALDRTLARGLVGEVVRLRQAADIGAFAAEVHADPELYGALLAAVFAQDESRARSALAALRAHGLPTDLSPHTRPRSRR
ncbi:hypothetical protein ACGFX4_40660 [Kitasatospora sp. NPDC048365]|uniref:hypothetical protein n=1 Tax=Kitasatospora sp. NPDC048365 TaxID=3364050 RepID=UPI00371A034A